MIRRSGLIALELALGVVAAAVIAVALVGWRLVAGPIDVGGLKQHVERELAAARGGRPVSIERVEIQWSQTARGLEVRGVNVATLDAKGGVLSRSREVALGISWSQLLLGRLALERIGFVGGDLTITDAKNGSTQLAFGPPGSPPDIVLPPPPPNETITQRVNRVLDGLANALAPIGPGAHLRAIDVTDLTLRIVDEAQGAQWQADGARLALARDGKRVGLSLEGALKGAAGGPSPFAASVVTDTAFQSAEIEARLERAVLKALLPPGMAGPVRRLEAPLTTTISAGLDRKAGVTRLAGEITVGKGRMLFEAGAADISGGRIAGRYDLEQDALILDEVTLAGARTRLKGGARIEGASALLKDPEAGAAPTPAPFNISLEAAEIDAPGFFEAPITLEGLTARGLVKPQERAVDVQAFEARIGAAAVKLAGRLFWAPDKAGKLHMGLKANVGVEGVVDPATVLRFWPVNAGPTGRTWAKENIHAGAIRDILLTADFTPDMTARGLPLPDKALKLTFGFDRADVTYVAGMTRINDGRGRAELRGNSFELWVDAGRIGPLALKEGRVQLTQFEPKGAPSIFSGRTEGEARAMVELLRQAPIGLDEKLPADPATIVGTGAVAFELTRPMLKDVPPEDYRFTVNGKIAGGGGVSKDGKIAVANWALDLSGDERALTFKGPLTVRSSPANVTWTQLLRDGAATPSRYTVNGRFASADLEALGYPVELFAKGPIGVALKGAGSGTTVETAEVDLDLAAARAALPGGFWTKTAGKPASARIEAQRQRDGALALTRIAARAPGVELDGAGRVLADGRLTDVAMTRVFVADRLDGAGAMKLDADGVMVVTGRGALMNIGAAMGGVDAVASEFVGQTRAQAPLKADIGIDKIAFQGGAALSNGRLAFITNGRSLTQLSLTGVDPKGGKVALAITPQPGKPTGAITFNAADAGFAWTALTGQPNVRGGAASAQGDWTPGQPSTAQLTLKFTEFRLVDMPVLARLLSSVGSLQGMADMLNGEGIAFTTLEAPIRFDQRRVLLQEARMSGPSIGLTAKGRVDLATGGLEIDGVVVPSYGLNSMVSNVPVLGELLASRKGEGVVGLTYSLKGNAETPKVGVNPLSALTPGILRRIFEPFRKPEPGEAPAKAETAANAPPG